MKAIRYLAVVLVFIGGLSSCGISEEKHNEIVAKLELELDECRNGEAKIIARVGDAKKDGDCAMVISLIAELIERFPETASRVEMDKSMQDCKNELVQAYNSSVLNLKNEKKAAQLKAEKEKAEREKNKTGSWAIKYYVDDFGDPTKEGYISYPEIAGLFSNTATQDSDCNFQLLINSGAKISIQLYEYAGNNPVKSIYSSTSYRGLLKDSNGKKHKIFGSNYGDRVTLNKQSSLLLHKALKNGGNIMVALSETENSASQYKFAIKNVQYYANTYRMFTEK